MIIKSVELVNFRNHTQYKLECTEATSLILGQNGCGKTSVLEAIYILMRGKSFRAVDAEIIKRGEEFYRAELNYYNGEKIVATYDGKTKWFVTTEKKNKRLPRKNRYPVVLFLPSDLHLMSASPTSRREYFDRILGQLNENYSSSLSRYEKALRQRNELLKTEAVSRSSMFSWNILLAKYGVEIERARQSFVGEINKRLTEVYRTIAKNQDRVELVLETQVGVMTEDEYLNRLEQDFERDKILTHTGFGVHRDDMKFYFNDKLADGSASRGEVRSIILALKFIEADLIKEKLRLQPVVLLDDVFSELDEIRRRCLVENFKNNQVIITSVDATQ